MLSDTLVALWQTSTGQEVETYGWMTYSVPAMSYHWTVAAV